MARRSYAFCQSMIWEAHRRVARGAVAKRVQAKSEEEARRKLPQPDLGRDWILVCDRFWAEHRAGGVIDVTFKAPENVRGWQFHRCISEPGHIEGHLCGCGRELPLSIEADARR